MTGPLCVRAGAGALDWNREHVWAKSHGDLGTATGPGTDIHHLRPTDVTVNSTRGNKDFDNGGSEVGEAPGNYTDDKYQHNRNPFIDHPEWVNEIW